MSDFNFGGDELPEDLAAAVRKSWSAPQESLFLQGQGFTPGRASPIGTPTISSTNLTSMTNPNEVLPLLKKQGAMHDTNNNNIGNSRSIVSSDSESLGVTGRLPSQEEQEQEVQSKQPDYQLFKHHYSISENARESVSDILHELDIESSGSTSPNKLSSGLPQTNEYISQQQQLFQQQQLRNPFGKNSRSNSNDNNVLMGTASLLNNGAGAPRLSNHPITTRRSSIQEVQWIRHLLNPRSSFSGPSQTEMPIADSAIQQRDTNTNVSLSSIQDGHSQLPESTKCWVTILENDSIECIKSMIVLYYSLSLTNSKYPMYVLHDSQLDVSQLAKYNIKTIPIPKEYFQDISCTTSNPVMFQTPQYQSLIHKNWFLLALFVSFLETNYELVCYITPTSMIIDNIDALLDDQSINNEIDNETCVLLSNVTGNDSDIPQLIIFKPNKEVSMCIKEFFTLYGNDQEKLSKVERLLQVTDFNILKELFGETWGKISSDGYVTVLEPNDESLDINNFIQKTDGSKCVDAKILDFKKVEPWNMKLSNNQNDGDTTVISKWYQVWLEFWNIYHNT